MLSRGTCIWSQAHSQQQRWKVHFPYYFRVGIYYHWRLCVGPGAVTANFFHHFNLEMYLLPDTWDILGNHGAFDNLLNSAKVIQRKLHCFFFLSIVHIRKNNFMICLINTLTGIIVWWLAVGWPVGVDYLYTCIHKKCCITSIIQLTKASFTKAVFVSNSCILKNPGGSWVLDLCIKSFTLNTRKC